MGAGSAILAIRDVGGLRSLASAGDVPATGSNLQLDSEFTWECLETGRVVLCRDAYDDSRICVEAARILRLRSAVAAPIHFRESLIGIIELFSSLPETFNGNHVLTLQEIGELIAPVLAAELRTLRSVSSNLTLARAGSQILAIPSEDLSNAIAINSSMVNLARLVGPALAGILIAATNEGWCFAIDGISYIAVITNVWDLSLSCNAASPSQRRLRQTLNGTVLMRTSCSPIGRRRAGY